MQLWLCLRLSELAVQCLPQQRPQALAILENQRIHAVNAAATMLGLEPGMDPASARALSGDTPLQLLQRDAAAENDTMEALSCWAYGVTPHLYRFRDDCLMLEISGSLRLYGGVDAILRHCRQGLACRGYSTDTALAPSPLAAWALSHTQDTGSELLTRPLDERLAALPLSLLEPLHEHFADLQRSGFKQLGDLLKLPPSALTRRCGTAFSELMQNLRGDVVAPLVHFEPPSCFLDSYPLGYPVSNQDELGPALEQLLKSLESYLRQRQFQTRQLVWHFYGQGGYHESLEVRASEGNTPRQDWYRLTRLRLERQPFQEEVERVQLRVAQLEAMQPSSGSLFRQSGQHGTAAQLVDLLSNRLGPQAIRSLRCRDAHLPEESVATVPPDSQPCAQAPVAAQRPFWLLSEPEPLRVNDKLLFFWGSQLELIYGPERIEDGWWKQGTSRDYFVAQNQQGQRFWVFHERRQRRWFMHGLFA